MKALEKLTIKINELIDLIKCLGLPIDKEKLNLLSNYLASQLSDIEKDLNELQELKEMSKGIDLITLFDYKENPFGLFEIENDNGETIFFDGDSFYGHYTKEEFLDFIKRLIKAYIETFTKEELL